MFSSPRLSVAVETPGKSFTRRWWRFTHYVHRKRSLWGHYHLGFHYVFPKDSVNVGVFSHQNQPKAIAMNWFNAIIFHKHTFKKQHPQTLNMFVSDELTNLYGCCSWGWHSFSMSSFSLPWVLPRTGSYRRNKAAIWRPATLKQLVINRFARNVLQKHLTWSMSWERNQFWRYHLGWSFSYKSTSIVFWAIPTIPDLGT